MSAPLGKIGHGTILKRGDAASPENFSEVAQILDVNPPKGSADAVETTTYQTTNRARTYIAGLIAYGVVPLKVLYDRDASHLTLYGDFKSGEVRYWEVVIPANTAVDQEGAGAADETWLFQGFVKTFDVLTPLAGRVEADIEIQVSDDITRTGT